MFLHLQQTLFYQQLRNEFANFVATHSLSLENYSVQKLSPKSLPRFSTPFSDVEKLNDEK